MPKQKKGKSRAAVLAQEDGGEEGLGVWQVV
jgi:hypothetical protein